MSEHVQITTHLENLQHHLKNEIDVLQDVVESFRELDEVAYNLGLIGEDESYATRVSWWPMVSVLGTYSSGKSTFINGFLGQKLQRTGTQAVDDKFTVICLGGSDQGMSTLPGTALDADPRFPFYQISQGIRELVSSSGHRVDSYLQVKTCASEKLKGRIIIDSPGFDADSQRTSTLRITKHIIDLSDLVLVFFDARHPEPGAMRDTLEHLVAETIDRPDANKFLFILNQIDVTAREDNLEEVVAAWQRSLAQAGLTAGRFYRIYDPTIAMPINDPVVKQRYETKLAEDLKEIHTRIDQVKNERAYRIVSVLEQISRDIEDRLVPQLSDWLARWKSRVFWGNLSLFILVAVLLGVAYGVTTPDLSPLMNMSPLEWGIATGVLIVVLWWLHAKVTQSATRHISTQIGMQVMDDRTRESLQRAFKKNASAFKFSNTPSGWGGYARRRLTNVRAKCNEYIKRLNDRFTNPSGAN
jgi:GTPase SAR1 family protein